MSWLYFYFNDLDLQRKRQLWYDIFIIEEFTPERAYLDFKIKSIQIMQEQRKREFSVFSESLWMYWRYVSTVKVKEIRFIIK